VEIRLSLQYQERDSDCHYCHDWSGSEEDTTIRPRLERHLKPSIELRSAQKRILHVAQTSLNNHGGPSGTG